jgi:hypothetical protein
MLDRCQYVYGSACDRPSWFSSALSKRWDGSQVPSCYCVLLMQPSRFKFIKMKPLCCKCYQIFFPKLCNSQLIQQIRIPWPLSQATTSDHPNVFASTFSLSEGLTSKAWEPSDRHPFPKGSMSFFVHDFPFYLHSYYFFSLRSCPEALKPR